MSVRSGVTHSPVDNTKVTVEDMSVGDNHGIRMEIVNCPLHLIISFCDLKTVRMIRYVICLTLESAKEEARVSIDQDSYSIFEEISMTSEQLRNVLPLVSRNSSFMQMVADEIGCEISEVDFLKSQMTEREESIKCLQNLNCQLQS
ncbi:hypothetical protein OSTOST_00708 [Ostertagia ostertagi]